MKTLTHFQRLTVLLLGTFVLTWSCRREVEVPLPALPKIVGKPSAATVGCMFVGAPGSSTLTMRLDIYVVDKNGRQVNGLKQTDFTIPTASGRTYQLQRLTSTALTDKAGGYSAMILLDQSGSIIDNDPKDLRIDASKIFMDYMGSDDVVALSSFSGSRLGPNFTYNFTLHSRFAHETSRMKRSLDSLSDNEGGGTPLYEATTLATNYAAQNGPTSNKAVIVFTDGQASGDLDGCIANAQQKGIPLYTIGLTNGVDVAVLSRMATETCGAFFYAKDAEQLVTSFGTLGNLLRGKAQVYRTEWTIVRSSGTWRTGEIVTSTMKVALPNGDPLDVPFWIKVK
ncbi:vWA domain-containing protein [Spirosoma validum]|uniref:VWA domain-containing protein n=1 Tax=Spirosoma validum TaxID=2771355 RepID=A0A927AXZ1_9BACT|nr:vWA domain-containing protein [Spirosoma validum]MBD2751844.1 VWA domain-containing protein [Spirosoma validum]